MQDSTVHIQVRIFDEPTTCSTSMQLSLFAMFHVLCSTHIHKQKAKALEHRAAIVACSIRRRSNGNAAFFARSTICNSVLFA